MIAVAPTDQSWFEQLRDAWTEGPINFWTPTPWNLARLKPGDRFYFLLKAPLRKIGGFGEFARYENLLVSEAWERFGTNNGVTSLHELLARTARFADARAKGGAPTEPDPLIGCIVLDKPQFWPNDRFEEPRSMGLEVPRQVVKVKYFEGPAVQRLEKPMVRLSLVTDASEILDAQAQLEATLKSGATRRGELTVGFQGGQAGGTAVWRSELDIWGLFRRLENRYWNAFGTGNPFEGTPSIVVEINPPIEGVSRTMAGAYARDANDHLFLVHRGGVGGGRAGVGKKAFLDWFAGQRAVVDDGGQENEVAVVGDLGSDQFPDDLAEFIRSVEQFKTEATSGVGPSVWWVNQGKTYAAERAGGYIWAPKKTKAGASLAHHTNVGRTKANEVIIHYRDGAIQALGRVSSRPRDAQRPAELPGEAWDQEGTQASVEYFELSDPIELSEIDRTVRVPGEGPFQENGGVKQGYLFPLNSDGADYLRQEFRDRWPADSPWGEVDQRPDALHVLLKWSQAPSTDTITEHRSIAERKGAVWWGRFGKARTADGKVDRVNEQVAEGIDTHAYLRGGNEVWRAQILQMSKDGSIVDPGSLPTYYKPADCSLFLKLTDFQHLPYDWPEENLVLDSDPENDEGVRSALRGQSSTLWVRESQPGPGPRPPKHLTMDWLVEKTLWERDDLEELIDTVLHHSPQVVLAGPPGTGKTWVAQHLAEFLTDGIDDHYRVVQFHPSYGYEEFIEGLRPVAIQGGGVDFKRVDGVVLQMAKEMGAGERRVLVIDEMNRANLPRVFGELMYLFEYRDQAISLQYTPRFSLPQGLLFLGTMNTADRSIRSIDIALRRRFDVFECPPNPGLLARYYERPGYENQVSTLLDGFVKLNEKLEEGIDRHHTIGHTFFMSHEMTNERLGAIWNRKLKPLIEEYFFDEPDIASEYAPQEFWPEIVAD